MDELHTLALEVARKILEADDEDPATIALARALLEEVAKTSVRVPLAHPSRQNE